MYLCITNYWIHSMYKHAHFLFFIAFSLASFVSVAQPGTVKPSPTGVFILLNNDIPTGKHISSYTIERSMSNGQKVKIGEAKTPSTFEDFTSAVNKAKLVFPAQPIPSETKLREIFDQVYKTPSLDSLRKTRLILPVKLALGVMYFDSTAKPNTLYRYSFTPVLASGSNDKSIITDSIRLPYQAKFDTIRYVESSFNEKSITITWRSAGKNPAPLFMVYKFRNFSPVPAPGQTSRYSVNDTTYFVFRDSIAVSSVTKDLQYFVSPFDHFGNSGISSQVAVITNDNFFKATFMRQSILFDPKQSGVELRWHHSDSPTVKHFSVYRSEAGKNGFVKIAEVAANDTSYLDQKIWPERSYDYYIEASSKAGKRSKTDKIMSVSVPGISNDRVTLPAPVIKLCVATPSGVRLLIAVNDNQTSAVRIFRGKEESLFTLPGTINPNGISVIEFIDDMLPAKDIESTFYAARNEKSGAGISALSAKTPVSVLTDETEVTYFEVFKSGNQYDFFWDDASARNNNIAYYALYSKQNRPGESFTLRSDHLQTSKFTALIADSDYNQVFLLKAFNKNGEVIGNSLEREIQK